jgi:hypothetical protein
LQNQTRTLQAYFLNLQALAETDASERSAVAVKELSDSINKVNSVSEDEIAINNEQKQALADLTKAVVSGVKAAHLNNALRRDAPIIGEQLMLHENLIQMVSSILKDSSQNNIVLLNKKEVIRPYVNKSISNQKKWIETRKRVLTASFIHKGLDNAVTASKQMQIVWEGLVKGKEDLGSIQLILNDIKEFALLTQQLKKAADSKGGLDD